MTKYTQRRQLCPGYSQRRREVKRKDSNDSEKPKELNPLERKRRLFKKQKSLYVLVLRKMLLKPKKSTVSNSVQNTKMAAPELFDQNEVPLYLGLVESKQ